MVNKENARSVGQQVKWIGSQDELPPVKNLEHKNVYFYQKCIYGPLTLSVGDFILVSNADAAEPDTVSGCDVARILHMYELRELTDREPCRAIVQWYSWPKAIPHNKYDDDEVAIDFSLEVIEEHRPYDNDVALGAIYRKCIVLEGTSKTSAEEILKRHANKLKSTACPMFVSRYRFVKVKRSYRLIPLEIHLEQPEDNARPTRSSRKSLTAHRESKRSISARHDDTAGNKGSSVEKRRRASMAASSSVEFIDVNSFICENKVSPIKIVGGRSVVRLSEKKNAPEINANYLPASPLTEKNAKVETPKSRASAARRNLNLSLDRGADTTADSDCLNYSIVQQTPDPKTPSNDMKIKLRLSERRRSVRLASMDVDPLSLEEAVQEPNAQGRKRLGVANGDIYHTPTKKSKEPLESAAATEQTPSTRRKSILKSATSRLAEGTPRRSIHLSNIVEQRVFEDDEIISTPKRGRSKKTVQDNDEDYSPKKSVQKTPTRTRRSSTTTKTATTPSKGITTATATPMTPSQKMKKIRAGELSPSMQQRTDLPAKDSSKSELQLAREQLHVSVVPKSLPCREREFENIYAFLEGKIQDQCGGCMYVSGVPGTGKTATVTGVIRTLQRMAKQNELPAFEYLEINGMRLTEPRQAYVQIYKQLTGKTVSWEQAHALLEKRFTTPAPRRVTTVLLVDELDILCNRRQDVVYNLLDWPTKSAAKLVVVTIANTMDLPERLLMGKVTSRLGLTRLTFQPYSHKQLQEIVTARLGGSETFKGEAVQLVARKVAAVSGDARRALDICRRATEIADTAAVKCVTMLHVQQALAEMIASAKVQAIRNCSRMEQIFLQAIAAEVTRTGVEETTFMGVYQQVETIAAFMGVTFPPPGRALRLCSKLGAERLIISEHSRNDLFQKILLNVSADDIHYALRVEEMVN
uniref:Origin recognition complex subunit 1 n=1 Tax=Drosophila melanogaster TaxID=7227 RepID=ORC1_DROME|nr:origin recognition complex subunit 1 [Drosophila melanogaster]O16810.2 RecName: Full=Origin recognition complex subunit 1; Short=DmORC1 [Drosophila melanogaster]AOQ07861.1 Orc1-RA [synthetic construct]AAF59236.1 origin recognition complex subunit 1 [Drosophila melanogaster]AAM11133.1 LD11626p [Drosophila melanogaster]AOQ14211.1 Orc1-PA [synthetic construct]|eukprot:NP_477303.1 origin recognition complex subunit 1 [Drosophila melanogaster]